MKKRLLPIFMAILLVFVMMPTVSEIVHAKDNQETALSGDVTGKVTVKKGLKKGTYNVKVKVKALGNNNYKASVTKTVTFKVKIK